MRDAFFGFLEPPRISSDGVLRKAIARGVSEGMFAYTSGSPTLGVDGKYQVALSKVALSRPMSDDEVDLDSGFIMVPASVPVVVAPTACPKCGKTPCVCVVPPAVCPTCGKAVCVCTQPSQPCPVCGKYPCGCKIPAIRKNISIRFAANRDEVFKSFQAIANLADKSDNGKIRVMIEGHTSAGYDANWLRNAVQEPLDEANIDGLQIE